ncbi:MAG TPA: aspartate aminotransferase family protein, partial [Chloroflexota bacterium]|nr:aspartate aminotransferase family protein [Chloroflexota bacterium]
MQRLPSTELYERAGKVLPGGVTANARTNAALGQPFYIARGEGAFVFDLDGRRYVDTCMSNGATLLGHGHPAVVSAVKRAADLGFACAYDGEVQVSLAERLVEQIPSFELVRFTTSGTEATFYVTRIARAYTGRTRVLKFEGQFHGFNDPLAFSFWPSPEEGGPPDAPVARSETAGQPPSAADEIVVAPFNDADAFRRVLARYGDELAAVIMEPISYDVGAILPDRAFLDLVRAETARRGIVLIFDEVLSGYRTGPDCAQGYLGVTPDLSTLGKAIGGGVPLSVFGGRRELMSVVSPLGPAIHTGTYNAHLIPMLAAHAFLDTIAREGFYDHLLGLHERLYAGLRQAFAEAGLPVRVQGVGARCGLYFGLDPRVEVTRYRQAARLDKKMMNAFCREMHRRNVYVNPAWHHGLSALHTAAIVDQIVEAAG